MADLSQGMNHEEWLQIYQKLKNESTYKFLYSDIDAYEKKINRMLNQDYRYQKNLLKKAEHNTLLDHLKINFLKISSDLHLLDLSPLALCIDYIFDNLLNCLRSAFAGFTNCVGVIREEQNTNNKSKFFALNRCQECQSHIEKIKIESLRTSVTLCEGKPTNNQMNRLNLQIDDLGLSFEDIELSLMIDEVLQGKDTVLNAKNNQITAIYQEISQYLENIPKDTLIMSRQDDPVERIKVVPISSISEEIQNGFSQMLRCPVRRLVERVFLYFKNRNIPKQVDSQATQTLLLTDQETIRTLNKSHERLKKEFEALKNLKREAERDTIRMIDEKQKHQDKIRQLSTMNAVLEQKYERLKRDSLSLKKSLEDSQASKKQMSETIIKQYTAEKATFLRQIHQMEARIQCTTDEMKRLRKMTQGSMISKEIQAFINANCSESAVQTLEGGMHTDNFLSPRSGIDSKGNSSFYGKKSFNNGKRIENKSYKSSYQEIEINPVLHENKSHLPIDNSHLKKNKGSDVSIASKPSNLAQSRRLRDEKDQIRVSIDSSKRLNHKISLTYEIDNQSQIAGGVDDDQLKEISFVESKEQFPPSNERVSQERTSHDKKSEKFHQTGKKLTARRQTSINHEVTKTLPWSFQNHQRKKKTNSSRMFVPIPNCSPFIGSQTNEQADWIETMTVNKAKRLAEQLRQSIIEEEDTEKVGIVSKLFFNYSNLRDEGLIDEIQILIKKCPNPLNSSFSMRDNHDLGSTQNSRKFAIGKKQSINLALPNLAYLQPSCSQIPLPSDQRRQARSPLATKVGNGRTVSNLNLSPQLFLPSPLMTLPSNKGDFKFEQTLSSSPIFLKKHIFMLFESENYIKKYEKGQDIWGLLQNSIMVDSSFMSKCDSVCIFFNKIEKENPRLHEECVSLITSPLKYLRRLDKKEATHMNSTDGFKKVTSQQIHKRYLSTMQEQNKQVEVKKLGSNQIRLIFLKLLRFHKVLHKKCQHIVEFLSLIGFKSP